MSEYRKISLKTIAAPGIGSVVGAPPVVKTSDYSVGYTCGNCGTMLLNAELEIHNLTIRCSKCGSYNSTDV